MLIGAELPSTYGRVLNVACRVQHTRTAMWSTFESLTGMAAEEPTQDGEQEAAPAEAPVEPAAEGTDLMTSLWGGLSAVAEGVQSQIEYQQKALDDEMVHRLLPFLLPSHERSGVRSVQLCVP